MRESCVNIVTAKRATGGLEYFTPPSAHFDSIDGRPVWQAGALIRGYSKVRGTTKMVDHIYVVDLSAGRRASCR
jgi:hypothetical protein